MRRLGKDDARRQHLVRGIELPRIGLGIEER
jgi:hypothetical protein